VENVERAPKQGGNPVRYLRGGLFGKREKDNTNEGKSRIKNWVGASKRIRSNTVKEEALWEGGVLMGGETTYVKGRGVSG